MSEEHQLQYPWDVAISLLGSDESLAAGLRDELATHVRGEIFLYSRKQEEIATDGELVELFTRVFRTEARTAVVLHREGWGESRYTAVEQNALRARYLAEGARRILIVSLDGTYPSNWYPEDHFRLSPDQFSIAQIAAVIAARVEELGGALGPEDPVEKAVRLQRERNREENLKRELQATGPEIIESESRSLFDQLKGIAERVSLRSGEKSGDQMGYDERGRACRLNYRWGSLVAEWRRQFQNSMEGVELTITILDSPTEFGGRRISEPRVLLDGTFDLAHPEEGLWGWQVHALKPRRRLKPFLPSDELAKWAANELLEITNGDRPQRSTRRQRRSPGWIDSWRY